MPCEFDMSRALWRPRAQGGGVDPPEHLGLSSTTALINYRQSSTAQNLIQREASRC
jgi:hypothetical protein